MAAPPAPPKRTPTSILSLPPELLLAIASYLPAAARTALKASNRTLWARTPGLALDRAARSALPPCARRAIAAHLAFDPRRARCPLCKHWYPRALFPGAASTPASAAAKADADAGAGAEAEAGAALRLLRRRCDSFGGPGAIDGPPGACGWHRGQVVRVVEAGGPPGAAAVERTPPEGWYCALEQMCYHCGAVRGWRACDCDCETCGVRSVRTYTRVVRAQSELGQFVFFGRGGETWVREWCGRLYVDVKVQYVD